MKSLQKMGGIAALVDAAAYVIGFVLAGAVLAPDEYGNLDLDPVQHAAFLADNQTIMHIWYLIIYVIFGIFLVVLALALHERLKASSPAIVKTATAFGLIWVGLVIASGMVANIGAGVIVDVYGKDPAQAGTLWLALHFVVEGIGGGVEIVGGIWILLLSWAALRPGGLPKTLNYLGAVIGVAGILTVIPLFGEPGGIVFGLGSIVWFIWLGLVMVREPEKIKNTD